jgi:phenylpropionate dioxygenase-like ring-hydroxylating dioxygenase large terminal subunit
VTMFKTFANQWTAIALSSELPRTKPLGLTIAGERIVLFRDRDGDAQALIDICPHRGVALSLGTVKDGCITCPFHGWRFDGTGACVKVPWDPDAKRNGLGATSLPLIEQAGLLWLYTAAESAPATGPAIPGELQCADIRRAGFAVDWNTHWTRAMENMLDFPHLPFVHTGSIGRSMRKPAETGRMDMVFEETASGYASRIQINGRDEPGELDYHFPNIMVLHIPMPWRTLKLFIACVPIDDNRTRMIVVSIRNFLKIGAFDGVFRAINRRVASEDKPILETSWPAEAPPPGLEKSVRLDKPTLYFRKIYHERIIDQNHATQMEQTG